MTTETTHAAPSAAITGAASGLGRELSIAFATKGYRVFGTALSPEEVEEVQHATNGLARLTICDITNDEAVKKSPEAKSTGRPLWVTVPSQRLIDATRLFSATTCVCTARPSGMAPRPIAHASPNTERPSGVHPVFWRYVSATASTSSARPVEITPS